MRQMVGQIIKMRGALWVNAFLYYFSRIKAYFVLAVAAVLVFLNGCHFFKNSVMAYFAVIVVKSNHFDTSVKYIMRVYHKGLSFVYLGYNLIAFPVKI